MTDNRKKEINTGMKKVVFQGKLTWIGRQPDANFWDKHWLESNRRLLYKSRLPWYARRAIKGVPASALILEAGCGSGFIAKALAHRSFTVYGVDNASATIETLKVLYPDMAFSCQDVRSMDFEDDKFDAYMSLGVIEHFFDEKDAMLVLREAIRVTKPGGTLFISVPFTNSLRIKKISKNVYEHVDKISEEFYQRAYTLDQFDKLFLGLPVKLDEIVYYGAGEGICREIGYLNFLRKNIVTKTMLKVVEQYTGLLRPYTHMIGFRLRNVK